jgi:SAM-dependent methyltransferase
MIFDQLMSKLGLGGYNSTTAYRRHLRAKLRMHRGNRDLAFAEAIGSESIDLFVAQGDGQVAVLKQHGLEDGMSIYDLGCGCGRTAQALKRSGWHGHYVGADIVEGLVLELKRKCPGYAAHVHRQPSLLADDGSLDMVFHWSVFTHISPEECFLYLEDTFRSLKPGGRVVFSFLEFGDPEHWRVFENRLGRLRRRRRLALLDTYLHRDWIRLWADKIGFGEPKFTDGQDDRRHRPMWQTVAALSKPAVLANQSSNS